MNQKILISFYLTPKTSEKVDDLLIEFKRYLPYEKRRKLTKSIFYETALQYLVADYQKNADKSDFLKDVLEAVAKKF